MSAVLPYYTHQPHTHTHIHTHISTGEAGLPHSLAHSLIHLVLHCGVSPLLQQHLHRCLVTIPSRPHERCLPLLHSPTTHTHTHTHISSGEAALPHSLTHLVLHCVVSPLLQQHLHRCLVTITSRQHERCPPLLHSPATHTHTHTHHHRRSSTHSLTHSPGLALWGQPPPAAAPSSLPRDPY
jgi:hypothetical protein